MQQFYACFLLSFGSYGSYSHAEMLGFYLCFRIYGYLLLWLLGCMSQLESLYPESIKAFVLNFMVSFCLIFFHIWIWYEIWYATSRRLFLSWFLLFWQYELKEEILVPHGKKLDQRNLKYIVKWNFSPFLIILDAKLSNIRIKKNLWSYWFLGWGEDNILLF